MKIIITESQYKKLETKQWLLRRYNLLMSEYKEAIEELDPCKFDTFDKYEKRVIVYIMDGLHHEYYLNDNFDYDGIILYIYCILALYLLTFLILFFTFYILNIIIYLYTISYI